ncbi:MAG: aminotransferase class III-fold pyridoxal phosphate-dependent enzyme [Candidatus Nitrosopumilus sp. bin_32a]
MVLDISKSKILKEKGIPLLPALAQTFSKSPSSFVEGLYPVYADSANGSTITDVDGNEYIDYLMALGPIVLGYNFPAVNTAISDQLKKGIIFSLPHYTEVNAAESLKRIIPCAQMTRFTKTGSDAVTGAVRACRAITNKEVILYCGSGGVWDDWYSILTNRNQGIPKFNKNLVANFNYNDIGSLEDLFEKYKNNVAAVIMEPSVFDKPENNFLNKAKKITHDNDALFVFDEILTGFRMSKGGGQEYFDVIPDIATFAKGIANGMPLGAIVGKSEYMRIFDDVFVSTTYAGEALSLAACEATVKQFEQNDVCGHMWKLGSKIKDNFNLFSKELGIDAKCIGFSPRLKLIFNDSEENDSLLYKSFFLQDLIENGIFMHPNTILLSYSHTMEQIDYTLEFIHKSMKNLKSAIENNEVEAKLKGNIAKSVIHRLE